MKRLVTLAACLAMLTFTGCANGILSGGLFNRGCDSRPGLFGGNGLLSDGPVRQFLRGDACDSCNAAAGQVAPGYAVPTCDACGAGVPTDPYAMPVGAAPVAQPATSYYPSNGGGVSLGQPMFENPGVGPIDQGVILGTPGMIDSIDNGLSEPPAGIN
ncbi:hypothetical protein [Mariniblastus fucicola]|uniref:Uncharacterized protein n=1 Tax=Mariniblastus fucicola TaxID=980251 RepID=A0A5B9P8C3_9BACT|nr:hypothetical protein [Mariniblastus fucicola]QEG21465.1 hypothetical protein MFFC18_13210 [Mariniblastus fucicola]